MESLPYPERMRALALHAREHAEHPGLPAFLLDMADQAHYGRRTALHLAMAARDIPYITKILAGADPELRRAALRAVRTLPVPDEAVPPALEEASTELRLAVYRTVVHSRRTELAERLLPEVHARWGAREAAVLLPGCGPKVVAQWLPSLAHAVAGWGRLARRHPSVVLDLLDGEFAEWNSWSLWKRRIVAIGECAKADPLRVLDLFERHRQGTWIMRVDGACLGPMVRADGARLVRLMAGRRWGRTPPSRTVLRRLAALPDEDLLEFAPRWPGRVARLMRAVPVERRAAMYALLEDPGLDALPMLHLLPRELAVAEARRLRAWHASVWHSARAHLDDPRITLRIAAHLPFEESEPELRAAALAGDPRHRGLARTLLLEAAQRTGDDRLLRSVVEQLVDRTSNERDPVRRELLTALRGLRLDDRSVHALETFAARVVSARDTSAATREELRLLADRILARRGTPALTRWALDVYERLVRRHGAEGLHRPEPEHRWNERGPVRPTLARVLPRGAETTLLDALLPHLRTARESGDFTLVVTLARSLGARARHLPELGEELRLAVIGAPEQTAAEAASLYLARRPGKDALAVALVEESPVTLRLAPVWRVIATRRADLLGDLLPVLAECEVEPGMAGRWTQEQRDRVGTALGQIVDDRERPVEERVRALRGLGRMPFRAAKIVEHALAGEAVVAEAAVEACAAHPRTLARVVLRIGGPVALAAAARTCHVTQPWRLAEVLGRALFEGGVGARKFAARQLVTQRVPGAVDLLLRAWADPRLHPDARIAVAVALRRMPEDPRAFAALADVPARHATELMFRTLFQAIPEDYAPEHRPVVAELVRALLDAAEGPGVEFRAAKAFATWVPWYRRGLDQIIEAAVTGGESDLTVFLTLVGNGLIREEALTVLRRLLSADDRPRARRVAQGLDRRSRDEPWRSELAHAAARMLAADPLHLPQAARLLVNQLTTEDPDPLTLALDLNALADLLRGSPQVAAGTAAALADHYGWQPPAEALLPGVQTLSARGDVTGALLALRLVERCGGSTERPDAWRAALDALRGSPHLEIRQLAWDVDIE